MEIIQSPTVPRLQQNLWLDSTNNTLNAPTKDGWKSITSNGGTSGGGMTKVTHDELVSLRDEGKLTPGALYRITDYVATTTQEGTKSANHPFDIVVVALDEKTLSEDAGAIVHSEEDLIKYKSVTYAYRQMDPMGGYVIEVEETAPFLMEASIGINGQYMPCVIFSDNIEYWAFYAIEYPEFLYIHAKISDFEKTDYGYAFIGQEAPDDAVRYTVDSGYFTYSNLPAWQLKYCLDNDTDRFGWAQLPLAPIVDSSAFSCYYVKHDFFYWYMFRRYPEMDNKNSEQQYAYVLVNSDGTNPDDPEIDWNNINPSQIIYTTKEVPDADDRVTLPNFMSATVDSVRTGINVPGRDAGKGVIYWMKDEHNNEAPFDFKGIMFSVAFEALNSDWLNEVFPDASFTSIDLYYLSYVNMSSLDVKDASIIPQNPDFKISNNISKRVFYNNSTPVPGIIIVNTGMGVQCIDNYFANCNAAIIGNNCGRIHLDGGSNTMRVFIANDCYNIELFSYNDCCIHSDCGDIKINAGGEFEIVSGAHNIIAPDPINCNGEQLRNTTQGVLYIGRNSNGDLVCWNPADISSAKPLPQTS